MALRERVAAPPGYLQGECGATDRGSLWHHPTGHRRALTLPGPGVATRESTAPPPRAAPAATPGDALALSPPASRRRSPGAGAGGIPSALPVPSR